MFFSIHCHFNDNVCHFNDFNVCMMVCVDDKRDLDCNSIHNYLGLSPIEPSGSYSQVSMDRIMQVYVHMDTPAYHLSLSKHHAIQDFLDSPFNFTLVVMSVDRNCFLLPSFIIYLLLLWLIHAGVDLRHLILCNIFTHVLHGLKLSIGQSSKCDYNPIQACPSIH